MHFKELKATVTEGEAVSINMICMKAEVLWVYMGCDQIHTHKPHLLCAFLTVYGHTDGFFLCKSSDFSLNFDS